MCVAIVGRVEAIDGRKARVEVYGNIITVETGVVRVQPGDYVLVHAGCAIEVLDPELAKDMLSLFNEIEDSAYE
jgi:hydrogenase expression/formation protein HypC